MKTLQINEKNDGKKLNTILLNEFKGLSTNTLYKALRKKDIRVNQIKVNENIVVHKGDEITIYIPDNLLEQTHYIVYQTIYEDQNVAIFMKPIGIETTGENSFTSYLQSQYPNSLIEPCHRLDRNTSGLILYAKNENTLSILLASFKEKEIEKHYICQVYGYPKKQSETLTAYLFKDTKKSIVYISDKPKKGYQKIMTSYTLLYKNMKNHTSTLDITLHTGKTHQIRAHLAHISLPIIGDGKYGDNEINKQFHAKTQKLCSYSLRFHFKTKHHLSYLNEKTFELQQSELGEYYE